MKTKRRTVLDVLVAMRKLISVGGICQNRSSQDRDGNTIGFERLIRGDFDKGAKLCPVGAMWAVVGDAKIGDLAIEALEAAAETKSIINWNDAPGRTKRQVLALFDKVIRRLEKEKAK